MIRWMGMLLLDVVVEGGGVEVGVVEVGVGGERREVRRGVVLRGWARVGGIRW